MFKKIKQVLYDIQTEAGIYSVNRVTPFWISAVFTLLMIVVTVYVMVTGKTFPHYNDLCMVYMGVLISCGTWLQGNKLTNSIWNTSPGEAGKPLSKDPKIESVADKAAGVVSGLVDKLNNKDKK